jgi:hypothetical protein
MTRKMAIALTPSRARFLPTSLDGSAIVWDSTQINVEVEEFLHEETF